MVKPSRPTQNNTPVNACHHTFTLKMPTAKYWTFDIRKYFQFSNNPIIRTELGLLVLNAKLNVFLIVELNLLN